MVERKQTPKRDAPIIILLCTLLMTFLIGAAPAPAAGTSTMEELKANYLTSIYDDCRIFLEGIELFISRDYPKFWPHIEEGAPMETAEIHRYIRELNYFKEQLDTLYEEFVGYAKSPANREAGGQATIKTLEAKIYQILSYAYMRTGDFAMGYALMSHNKIMAHEFTIPLMDIEGHPRPFPLTRRLKKLQTLISEHLNVIELRMKYFFPTDLEAINAYLTVVPERDPDPITLTFLSYYDQTFLELNAPENPGIHFSEIIHFFHQMKYNNAFSKGIGNTIGDERIYHLPIIKGTYAMDFKEATILGEFSRDNRVLSLERLCYYRGFVRTDFRNLKGEERGNVKLKTDKELYISRVGDESPAGALENESRLMEGAPLRYGRYTLLEGSTLLGTIELVPCYKGRPCRKRSRDKAVTEVKVYNHELTFYEDTLDSVRMNTRMHGHPVYATPSPAPEVDTGEIHIGRGCAPKK